MSYVVLSCHALLMTTNRRPATIADLTPGATAYRGKGKVAYRVFEVRDRDTDRPTVTASMTTTRPGTKPTWFFVSELTVEA